MTLINFLELLNKDSDSLEFNNCIEIIDKFYTFSPTSFINGEQHNPTGENNRSCKIFAFGLLHKLTEQQTLACFGEYYRNDVLKNPEADNHQNIRQFMLFGWAGIKFSAPALTLKN